jgi:hypothetical protein
MNYKILILAIVVVLLASCSRFDHDFAPKEVIDFEAVLFAPMQVAFDGISGTNLEPVLDYFSEDYLHSGIDKAGREAYLQSLYSVSSDLDFVVSLIEAQELNSTEGVASWNLKVYTADSKTLLADSTFVNDRLQKQNGAWKLRGNGIDGNSDSIKQRIIIEYFTFVGCPNCPIVESRIRQLQTAYPTQLSYVEYHVSGELSFGMSHNDLLAYYAAYPSPVSIIQGGNKLSGSTTDILDSYTNLTGILAEVDAQIKLENFSYSVDNRSISASIRLNPLVQGFDQDQLRLKYVLMKKTWNFANPEADPHHNVALAKGSVDISAHDLANEVSFELISPIDIPADAYMLVYVQKVPASFANNATIFNGIEVPIAAAK